MTPPPSPSPWILELDSVDVPSSADSRDIVVRDLNWRVGRGDAWLVAGPARSGKSSVLAVAAGLVRPVGGRQRLFGSDFTDLKEPERVARRLRIGVVFGGGGRLFGPLTVLQNLALPLMYHGHESESHLAERVSSMLSALGLMPYARRWPRELNRGVAQRVALARALILEPEVLFLDDPLAGLADDDAEWWSCFLADCTAGRCSVGTAPHTFVVTATDLRPWTTWPNRFAVVKDGGWRVLEDGGGLGAWLRPARGS